MDFTVIDSTGSINCINVFECRFAADKQEYLLFDFSTCILDRIHSIQHTIYSFGAVITDVDSERVKLSAFREVLGYVGTFCASSVPTFIVGKMLDAGVSQEKSWFTVGILVAAIAVSTIFLMWKFTAGKESEEEVIETENINVRGFLKTFSV